MARKVFSGVVRRPARMVWLLVCLFVFAFQPNATQAEDALHISSVAEFYYLHQYKRLKRHKAFAVGPGGYWAAWQGAATGDRARREAIKYCQGLLKQSGDAAVTNQKCVAFDVNGKPTGKAAPIGVAFGTVLPEPDWPMLKGKSWQAYGKARGTMLMVHGCDGVGYPSGWLYAWASYYRAIGLRVWLPDSFANPFSNRPPAVCGMPGAAIDRQTEVIKLRMAETRRTIAAIRQKFPGEPLFLHGHSEGGVIVQGLGEKVDGIIATGIICGFSNAGVSNTPAGVPTLVLIGTKDSYVPEGGNAKKFVRLCKNARGAGPLRAAVIQEMGHYAAPWWPEVMAEIAKFLKAEPIAIRRRKDGAASIPAGMEAQLKSYRAAPQHKALAGTDQRLWGWEQEYETPFDAEEAALFYCDYLRDFNPYANSDHAHSCSLWDSNDKAAKK